MTKLPIECPIRYKITTFDQTIILHRIVCLFGKVDLTVISVNMVAESGDRHLKNIMPISIRENVRVVLLQLILFKPFVQFFPRTMRHKMKMTEASTNMKTVTQIQGFHRYYS